MPRRLEFLSEEGFKQFLFERVDPNKYDLYWAAHPELIAMKNVSTSPRLYGSMPDCPQPVATRVAEELGKDMIVVEDFDWQNHIVTFPSGNIQRMRTWLTQYVDRDRYDLYYSTEDSTGVAVKNVSTEPRIDGMVRNVDENDFRSMANDLGMTVITLRKFVWDAEMSESTRGIEDMTSE